jgi:hypothetical protein
MKHTDYPGLTAGPTLCRLFEAPRMSINANNMRH